MEPIFFAFVGIGLMMGLPATGSAIGFSICGNAMLGAMKKAPDKFGMYMTLSALPSSNGIYGFVAFFLTLPNLALGADMTWSQAGAIFGTGLLLGIAALFAGVKQAEICASGISSIASGRPALANTFILAALPEFFAILALLCFFLVNNAMF